MRADDDAELQYHVIDIDGGARAMHPRLSGHVAAGDDREQPGRRDGAIAGTQEAGATTAASSIVGGSPAAGASAAPATGPSYGSWHLNDATGRHLDINVTPVWPQYTGRGVHVGVYDEGVQESHPD